MKVTFWTHPSYHGITVPAQLLYDSADPYAVTLVFASIYGPVTWACTRDLLRAGLCCPSGDGDIRITPGFLTIAVHLRSPHGNALFVFSRDDIEVFLRTTYHAVPDGTEDDHVDWSELDRLLSETA